MVLTLTYFDVRGRGEPILLLLVDSGVSFEHEVMTSERWLELKQAGAAGPPEYPFGALPVLTFSHGARGGNDTKLSETGAILTYLEGKHGSRPILPPDGRARLEMIREASAFVMSKIFALCGAGWLDGGASVRRGHLRHAIVEPFLSSLHHHLSSSFFPPLLSFPLENGRPGTSLTGAAATATVALSLISELFPRTLGAGPEGGMAQLFPRCEALRVSVEARPRIAEWIKAGGRVHTWMRNEWGSQAAIRAAAEQWDTERGNRVDWTEETEQEAMDEAGI